MQRIVTEEEWKSQYQAGFIRGLERGPHTLSTQVYNGVYVMLLEHLSHCGYSVSRYRDVLDVILAPLNPSDPPDPELDQ